MTTLGSLAGTVVAGFVGFSSLRRRVALARRGSVSAVAHAGFAIGVVTQFIARTS